MMEKPFFDRPAIAPVLRRNYTIGMRLRTRILLALIGLMLVCLSCIAAAYLLWPLDKQRVQDPVAPTLFIPPA